MWALIKGSEDGNPLHFIGRVSDLLGDPVAGYGVDRFEGEEFLRANPDPNYWPEGVAVLVQVSVVVPEPVTTAYQLPRGH